MTADWRLVRRRVARIGVLQLWQHQDNDDRWAVSLDNRTYHNFFEIPAARVTRWQQEFGMLEKH